MYRNSLSIGEMEDMAAILDRRAQDSVLKEQHLTAMRYMDDEV